jgi:hypothetical protein
LSWVVAPFSYQHRKKTAELTPAVQVAFGF